MRTVLDFPDGSGSESSSTPRPATAAASRRDPASALPASDLETLDAAPLSTSYVPGPFHESYVSGIMPLDTGTVAPYDLGLASGGFRPHVLRDAGTGRDEPICREPQSVVVSAIIAGILLAVLGYYLDVQ